MAEDLLFDVQVTSAAPLHRCPSPAASSVHPQTDDDDFELGGRPVPQEYSVLTAGTSVPFNATQGHSLSAVGKPADNDDDPAELAWRAMAAVRQVLGPDVGCSDAPKAPNASVPAVPPPRSATASSNSSSHRVGVQPMLGLVGQAGGSGIPTSSTPFGDAAHAWNGFSPPVPLSHGPTPRHQTGGGGIRATAAPFTPAGARAGHSVHSARHIVNASPSPFASLVDIGSALANKGETASNSSGAVVESEADRHLVLVQALDMKTTHQTLYDTFFPLGASKAAVFNSEEDLILMCHASCSALRDVENAPKGDLPASLMAPPPGPYPLVSVLQAGRRRSCGVVFFKTPDMARMAASKINDFVPHGQSNPLHCVYADGTIFSGTLTALCEEGVEVLFSRDPATTFPPIPGMPPSGAVTMQASLEAPGCNGSSAEDDEHTSDAHVQALLHATYSHMAAKRKALGAMTPHTVQHLATHYVQLADENDTGAIATCARLFADGINVWSADDVADAAVVLAEGLHGGRRGSMRCFDAACRLVKALAPSHAARKTITDLWGKAIMAGLLHGVSRPSHRLGCAVALASLFEAGFIGGNATSMAVKLLVGRALPTGDRPLLRCLEAAVVASRALRDAAASSYIADDIGVNLALEVSAGGNAQSIALSVVGVSTPEETQFLASRSRFVEKYGCAAEASDSGSEDSVVNRAANLPSNAAWHMASNCAGAGAGVPAPRGGQRHADPVDAPLTLAATVYLTKVPRTVPDAELRAWLLPHGQLNKVRLYDGSSQPKRHNISGDHNTSSSSSSDSCFGFVEFASQQAAMTATAALDRATLRLVGPASAVAWDRAPARVLAQGGHWELVPPGTAPEAVGVVPMGQAVAVATTIRCSPARAAIHDADAQDAVITGGRTRVRDCTFGLAPAPASRSPEPNWTVESTVGTPPAWEPLATAGASGFVVSSGPQGDSSDSVFRVSAA